MSGVEEKTGVDGESKIVVEFRAPLRSRVAKELAQAETNRMFANLNVACAVGTEAQSYSNNKSSIVCTTYKEVKQTERALNAARCRPGSYFECISAKREILSAILRQRSDPTTAKEALPPRSLGHHPVTPLVT
jgi:hypothetical protein